MASVGRIVVKAYQAVHGVIQQKVHHSAANLRYAPDIHSVIRAGAVLNSV